MDMDQLLYEAGRLHDAICLMNQFKGTIVASLHGALLIGRACLSGSIGCCR